MSTTTLNVQSAAPATGTAAAVVYDPIEWGLRSRFGGAHRRTPEEWLWEHEGTNRLLTVGEDSEFVLAAYAYHQDYLYTDFPTLNGVMNKMLLMLAARFYQRMSADEQDTVGLLAALRCTDSRWRPLDECLSVRNQTLANVEWLIDPSALAPRVMP
jgi:hypothetical protein